LRDRYSLLHPQWLDKYFPALGKKDILDSVPAGCNDRYSLVGGIQNTRIDGSVHMSNGLARKKVDDAFEDAECHHVYWDRADESRSKSAEEYTGAFRAVGVDDRGERRLVRVRWVDCRRCQPAWVPTRQQRTRIQLSTEPRSGWRWRSRHIIDTLHARLHDVESERRQPARYTRQCTGR